MLSANEAHLANILVNLGLVTDTAVGRLDELEAALQNLPDAVTRLFDVINDGEYLNINVPVPHASRPAAVRRARPAAARSLERRRQRRSPAAVGRRSAIMVRLDDGAAFGRPQLLGRSGGRADAPAVVP